ncbi:XRE family transcriptional regulator [bacterium D16-51]|nr:XRE family transcriptional regulator [bacterium D16-59]RKI54408.1 XRE family transcriptional regulator [bacterium D16-51]
MGFGEIIVSLRKRNNINQKQLGDVLGVSSGAIGMWENNKRQPDFDTLKKIALYFKVTTDYILDMPQNIIKEEKSDISQINIEMDEKSNNLISAFLQLNEDNKDIAIGEVKKILKEQRLEYAMSNNKTKKKA